MSTINITSEASAYSEPDNAFAFSNDPTIKKGKGPLSTIIVLIPKFML